MEGLKGRVRMNALQEVIMDEIEIRIFSHAFEKRNGQLGQSHFSYYTTDAILLMKKQFSLVDRRQLRTTTD